MASITKYQGRWRAHVYVGGVRESRLFRLRQEARSWGVRREAELRLMRDASDNPYQDERVMPLDRIRDLPQVTHAAKFAGVYFLWNRDGQLVYIGQSKDLAKRVATHLIKPPVEFSRATYIQIPHPWQLAVERLYIDAYIGQRLDDGSGVTLANCG